MAVMPRTSTYSRKIHIRYSPNPVFEIIYFSLEQKKKWKI